MASHRELGSRSVIVNRMTGVSGMSSFMIEAASAPFDRGHSKVQKYQIGSECFRLLDSVYAVNGFANFKVCVSAFEQHPNGQTHCGAVIGNQYSFGHEVIVENSGSNAIQESLYYLSCNGEVAGSKSRREPINMGVRGTVRSLC